MHWIKLSLQKPEEGVAVLFGVDCGPGGWMWQEGMYSNRRGCIVALVDGEDTPIPYPTHWSPGPGPPSPIKHETTRSIHAWGLKTFGQVRDPAVYIGRALEEFAELVGELNLDEDKAHYHFCDLFGSDTDLEIGEVLGIIAQAIKDACSVPDGKWAAVCEESADVRIVLQHLHGALGHDMAADEARKMQVNRERKWPAPDGEGISHHLED